MMRRVELHMIRHAPSVHDKGMVPPRDPEADLGNRTGFEATARHLPDDAVWWVSPMQRCRMTADMLLSSGAKAPGLHHDDRLIEQDYGRFHGQDISTVWAEVEAGPRSNWHFLHPDFTPPEGESFAAMHQRGAAVLRAIEKSGLEKLIIIGHAMMTRSIIAHAMGLPTDKALALGISPLSVTTMTYLVEGHSTGPGNGGRWMLNTLNRVY